MPAFGADHGNGGFRCRQRPVGAGDADALAREGKADSPPVSDQFVGAASLPAADDEDAPGQREGLPNSGSGSEMCNGFHMFFSLFDVEFSVNMWNVFTSKFNLFHTG
jgi:hypothetical protein